MPTYTAKDLETLGRQIGALVKPIMLPGTGFAVLTFDTNTAGTISYTSSADRDDMIKALEELLGNLKASRRS